MLRRSALLCLLSLLVALSLAAPAAALTTTSPAAVAAELQRSTVYVDPSSGVDLDEERVLGAVSNAQVPVYVAAVPRMSEGALTSFTVEVLDALGDESAVVLVIAPRMFRTQAGAQVSARGIFVDDVAEAAEATRPATATDLALAFVQRLEPGATSAPGTSAPPRNASGGGGALLPVLLLGALGFGAYALRSNRRQAKASQQELQDARADVESLYGRLGSDVQLLSPGDDAIARQALADAGERYNATGALMARASTPGEFAAARRTAAEGLAAARVVRQRLGLDPGPEVPMPHGSAPQLDAPARVRVGDDEYDASPRYEPGRPHYYEGGYHQGRPVPGGWYATPFWQTLLLSSVLRGGMGGHRRRSGGVFIGGMGGGFGGGFGGGGITGRGGGFGGGGRRGGGFGGGGRRGGGGSFGGGGGRRGGGGGW